MISFSKFQYDAGHMWRILLAMCLVFAGVMGCEFISLAPSNLEDPSPLPPTQVNVQIAGNFALMSWFFEGIFLQTDSVIPRIALTDGDHAPEGCADSSLQVLPSDSGSQHLILTNLQLGKHFIASICLESLTTGERSVSTVVEFDSGATPQSQFDLIYARDDDSIQKLSLSLPTNLSPSSPLVTFIHGGGFTGGTRTQAASRGLTEFFNNQLVQSAPAIMASLDYRVVLDPAGQPPGWVNTTNVFPIPMNDVACGQTVAVHVARALGGQASVKTFPLGHSAGGFFAAMLGATEVSQWLTSSCVIQDPIPRPRAVISSSGVFQFDLLPIGRFETIESLLGIDSLFDPNVAELVSQSQPITWVSDLSSPALLISGQLDGFVNGAAQADSFAAQLTASGVGVKHDLIQTFGHNDFINDFSDTSRSDIVFIRSEIDGFLAQ